MNTAQSVVNALAEKQMTNVTGAEYDQLMDELSQLIIFAKQRAYTTAQQSSGYHSSIATVRLQNVGDYMTRQKVTDDFIIRAGEEENQLWVWAVKQLWVARVATWKRERLDLLGITDTPSESEQPSQPTEPTTP